MRRFITLLLLICLTLTNIYTEELHIGTVDILPRGFINRDGEIVGSSYDLLNTIATHAGYTPVNKLLPFPRILSDLRSGDLDIALLVPTASVTEVAIPIGHLQDVNFILIGCYESSYSSLDDLDEKRVGYLRGSGTSSKLIEGQNVNIFEANDYHNLLKMLISKRIDAIIGPEINIYWTLNDMADPTIHLGERFVLKSSPLHLVISKKSSTEELTERLTHAIDQLTSDGTIESIIRQYNFSK